MIDQYETINLICKGQFGEIFEVKHKESDIYYTMKTVSFKELIKNEQTNYFEKELEILKELNHPNIVKFEFNFSTEDLGYLLLEYCPQNLFMVIRRLGSISEESGRFITAELVLALEYIYKKGIIHQNFQPKSIWLTKERHVKLSDFGTSRKIESSGEIEFHGIAEYVSPEKLKSKISLPESDLWALGCSIYQLFAGKPPFQAPNEFKIYQQILKRRFNFPNGFPSLAKDLVNKLLVIEPEKRIGSNGDFNSIKNHPFLAGTNWEDLYSLTIPEFSPYLPTLEKNIQGSRKTRIRKTRQKKKKQEENEQYAGIDPQRVRLLKEQKKRSRWAKYLLPNELIVEIGLIYKKKGLFPRKRQLILTDFPRFIYIDPKRMKLKGEIQWDTELHISVANEKRFLIVTERRKYNMEDAGGEPEKWARAVDKIQEAERISEEERKKTLNEIPPPLPPKPEKQEH